MPHSMDDETPSERYAHMTKETEVGSTSGDEHADVLARTLGRERGMMASTGVSWDEPVIEGQEFAVAGAAEKPQAPQRKLPDRP